MKDFFQLEIDGTKPKDIAAQVKEYFSMICWRHTAPVAITLTWQAPEKVSPLALGKRLVETRRVIAEKFAVDPASVHWSYKQEIRARQSIFICGKAGAHLLTEGLLIQLKCPPPARKATP